jgi:hypothetical protein
MADAYRFSARENGREADPGAELMPARVWLRLYEAVRLRTSSFFLLTSCFQRNWRRQARIRNAERINQLHRLLPDFRT